MSRTNVLGVEFDNLTIESAAARACEIMGDHRCAYMVTPNPEIVMAAWENPDCAVALENADLVLADGIGVVKAAKILGTPLAERVPGIDTATMIMEKMAKDNKSVFLFGAKPGVAETAAEVMEKRFPGLVIAGCRDGYYDDDAEIIEAINAAKPDFLLVCLGAPKQELWMHKNAGKLDVGLMAGLGGVLDVFAGVAQRAPECWQKLNLEWLYRCIKEPKRLKRIYKLPLFLIKAVGIRIKRMFHGK